MAKKTQMLTEIMIENIEKLERAEYLVKWNPNNDTYKQDLLQVESILQKFEILDSEGQFINEEALDFFETLL